ncbi:MAG: helix-turn-helix domain-containing protein [Bacteroidales bacterium]|nr:helix-turn-helix domain-containing protein [Bacteroidales bacterium]MCM1147641.1 helix-turn-helix domain-containing protein [Bacteroidales bacterium]MCM1206432.1 helix-turn-helix domain-containing protein [Bacillota bacterium]MCM1509165.1 helix-turn-helix domain-containing protein [Clostridium sp.]
MKRLSAAVTFLLICMSTRAAGNISIHTFGDSEGFFHSKVTGICQDQRGFLWMSSWSGLYRYDGSRFITFSPTQCEGSANGDDRLDEARADAYGNIWCRSYRHPYMFDVRRALFRDVGKEIEKRLGRTLNVRRIICTGHDVWLQSDDSIAVCCAAGNVRTPKIFSPTTPLRLCGGEITGIKEDKYGRTWIISRHGITITDRGTLSGKRRLLHIPGDFLAMEEAREGEYYIIGRNGTVHLVSGIKRGGTLNGCSPRIRPVPLPAGLRDIQRTTACDGAEGELALATSAGLFLRAKGQWQQMRYATKASKTLRIKRDDIGRYWILTDKPGVTIADPKKGTVRQLPPPRQDSYSNRRDSWFFHPLPGGDMLLMAQDGGLCLYDNATGRLIRPKGSNGLPYKPQVGRSFTDAEGNLWLFNEPKDVVRISPSDTKIIFRNDGNATKALFRDSRGNIWRATENGRLSVHDPRGGSGYMTADGTLSKSPAPFPTVYSLAETGGGTIWAGTKDSGLYRLRPKGNRYDVTHYAADSSNPSALHSGDVFALATDRHGRLWAGTYSCGLFLAENPDAPDVCFRKVKGLPRDFRSGNIRALLCLHNGVIAAGTSNGLLTFTADSRHPADVRAFHNRRDASNPNSLSNNVIMQLFEDSRRNLYAVTPTSGVCQAHADSLLSNAISFKIISTRHGAPSDMPLSIAEDRRQQLWMTHSNGIACLHADRSTFSNLTAGDDGERPLLSPSGIVTLADGRLLTGTDGGTALWNPCTRNRNSAPRIAVTSLDICGKPRFTDTDFTDTLLLGSNERDITVTLAAVITSGNTTVRYASQTDTARHWNFNGSNARLALLNLTPGWHSLRIRSTDAGGVWADNIRTLHIHVDPLFHETRQATMLYILFLLIFTAAAAGTWAYIYRLRLRLRTRMENIKMRMDFINNVAPELRKTEDDILRRVREYIDSRLGDENLSVPEIAAEAGMSVANFRARFKQLTGVSPVDYLRHYRIGHAKRLLRSTDLTVAEVAYRCGFTDPKYFSRVFKTIEGRSPSAFKEGEGRQKPEEAHV